MFSLAFCTNRSVNSQLDSCARFKDKCSVLIGLHDLFSPSHETLPLSEHRLTADIIYTLPRVLRDLRPKFQDIEN